MKEIVIFKKLLSIGILFFLLISIQPTKAQEERIRELYSQLSTERSMNDSLLQFMNAKLKEALKNNDTLLTAHIYLQKGRLYHKKDERLSLNYTFKAKELFQKSRNNKLLAQTYRVLGGNMKQINMSDRIDMLKMAISLSYKEKDTVNYISSYMALGLTYSQNNWLDSAIFYYNKCSHFLQSFQDSNIQSGLYVNKGTVYLRLENYPKAASCFYKAIQSTPYNDINQTILTSQTNLLTVYTKMNIPDSIFHYLNIIQQHYAERPDLEIYASSNLVDYYSRNGEMEKAFYYSNALNCIKEEQLKESNAVSIDLLTMEYESKLKEEQLSKLHAEMEKATYMRVSLIIILALVLLFAAITIYLQKQKAKKEQEAQKKIMEADLKNSELQRKYLNDELKYTNKELTSFATSIVENRNILTKLKNKISRITKERSVREMREQLHELNILLQHIFHNDMHREEFLKRSKQLNYSLVFYLKTRYEELSESDINILILIFLKFSSKEISALYNIQVKSVEQRRYLIRNKLGLKTTDSFDEFFDRALADIRVFET